jgi:hypothetical protein
MLRRLDSGALGEGEADIFSFAEGELTRTASFFEAGGQTNLEIRGHGDTENFLIPSDYIRLWNRAKNLLDLGLEGRITDHGYGLFTFSLGNSVFNQPADIYGPDGSEMVSSAFFGKSNFSSNLPFVYPAIMEDVNMNFPVRSFVSLGGRGWNLALGRDRLSWGPGESGNLLVGSHIEYHDNARLCFYNHALKYTLNLSSFPYPDEYYEMINGSHDKARPVVDAGETVNFTGIRLFIAHRFEWRILKNKLNMAFTDAIMYEHENGYVDPTVLSPLIILHNLYRRENSNSILSLEMDFSPVKRINLYGAVVVDEFRLGGGEPDPGKEDEASPNGFGYLAGVKTAFPLKAGPTAGLLSLSLEGAYTDPYLYLRSSVYRNRRGLNFVTATRYFAAAGEDRCYYNEDFLGYRWGGDAVVANLRAGYEVFGAWNLTGNFMFMAHGTLDKYTIWSHVNVSKPPYNAVSPSASHPGESDTETTGSYADPHSELRNAVSYLSAFSLLGSLNFWRNFSVYGQADLVHIVNHRNLASNPPATDIQFTLGLTFAF